MPKPLWKRAAGKLRRPLVALRFRLVHRRKLARADLTWIVGRPFIVLPEVFHPALFDTSDFAATTLAHYVPQLAAELGHPLAALDLGCGSGVLGISAAVSGKLASLLATDLNPHAVRCATINALLNGVDHLTEAREGDLFAPVGDQRFDLIIYSPPYFAGEAHTWLERAFRSGPRYEVMQRFFAAFDAHAQPDARLFLVLSSRAPLGQIHAWLTAVGWDWREIARRDLWYEDIILMAARRTSD